MKSLGSLIRTCCTAVAATAAMLFDFSTASAVEAKQPLEASFSQDIGHNRYYHDPAKKRGFYFFLAEGLGLELRKEIKVEFIDLMKDEKRTRPGDKLFAISVPTHEVIASIEIPKGDYRGRLHRKQVKQQLRKLGDYLHQPDSKTANLSTQAEPRRIVETVVELNPFANSATYVVIAADPCFEVADDPKTAYDEASWNFEDRYYPSSRAIIDESKSTFSIHGTVKFPKATLITWIAPKSDWSSYEHMMSVDNFYRGYWLQQNGFLLRINGSAKSCFDIVRAQKLILPTYDNIPVAQRIDTVPEVVKPPVHTEVAEKEELDNQRNHEDHSHVRKATTADARSKNQVSTKSHTKTKAQTPANTTSTDLEGNPQPITSPPDSHISTPPESRDGRGTKRQILSVENSNPKVSPTADSTVAPPKLFLSPTVLLEKVAMGLVEYGFAEKLHQPTGAAKLAKSLLASSRRIGAATSSAKRWFVARLETGNEVIPRATSESVPTILVPTLAEPGPLPTEEHSVLVTNQDVTAKDQELIRSVERILAPAEQPIHEVGVNFDDCPCDVYEYQ